MICPNSSQGHKWERPQPALGQLQPFCLYCRMDADSPGPIGDERTDAPQDVAWTELAVLALFLSFILWSTLALIERIWL